MHQLIIFYFYFKLKIIILFKNFLLGSNNMLSNVLYSDRCHQFLQLWIQHRNVQHPLEGTDNKIKLFLAMFNIIFFIGR